MQFLPGRSVRSMRSIFAAAGAVALLATAACTIDDDGDDDTENAASETTSATEIDSELAASVKDNATGVKVDKPITVTDSDGIDSVALTDGYGTEIEGKFNDDKTEWTSTGNLEYSSNYTLDAKAGKEKLNQSFTSFSPNMLTDGAMAPLDGATVGIGQTISLRLDRKSVV